MDIKEIPYVREEVFRTPHSARVTMLFLMMGLGLIALYFVVSLNVASSTADYFTNPKAVRDSAISGSVILGNLASIESANAWLAPLKFLGISLILFSIAISFGVSIMKMLKLRLQVMGEFLEATAKH